MSNVAAVIKVVFIEGKQVMSALFEFDGDRHSFVAVIELVAKLDMQSLQSSSMTAEAANGGVCSILDCIESVQRMDLIVEACCTAGDLLETRGWSWAN